MKSRKSPPNKKNKIDKPVKSNQGNVVHPVGNPVEKIKNRYVLLILIIFSFILYGNTLQKEFGYVLDDGYIITNNRFVHRGIKGILDIISYDTMAGEHGKDVKFVAGGRYRPVSVVTFAIEWQLFSYGIWIPKDKYTQLMANRVPGLNPYLIEPMVDKRYKDKTEFERNLTAYMGKERAELFKSDIYKYTEHAFGNPRVSHFVNILLYGLTAFLLFIVFAKLLNHSGIKPYFGRWYLSVPFVTSLLWLAHPVHTEVVANIKGRDEIMALLGALAALFYSIKYVESKKVYYLFLIFIFFFIGMASKENAVTFLSIIPFSFIFFSKNISLFKVRPIKHNIVQLKKIFIPLLPSLLAATLFLYIRYKVIGFGEGYISTELMNNPFAEATMSQRYGTVFFTFFVYLRILLFPHPLTYDYYPYHIPLVDLHEIGSLIPLIFHLALFIFALIMLFHPKGKNNVYAYGIWFYFSGLSIVSNLPFSIGAFMAERFLYLPGVGFSIICAYFLVQSFPGWLKKKNFRFVKNYHQFLLSFLAIILALYTLKTVIRNTAWTDNFTLFTNDIKYCPNSAKGHTTAGERLLERARAEKDTILSQQYFDTAIKYFHRSLEIYPRYIAALLDLGIAYEKGRNDYKTAVKYYMKTIALKKNYEKAYHNISNTFYNRKDFEFELKVYEKLYQMNPNRFDVLHRLGSLYGAYKKDTKKSIHFLERAIKLNSNNPEALTDLGVAYGIDGQYAKSIPLLNKASQINPDSPVIYGNLKAIYRKMGDTKKADYYSMMQQQAYQRLKQRSSRINSVK